ncbi:biotin/lipoate--protein ligase family protein [Puniceibacterium sediminis]|uniref:Biotin-(Acetyl-CoA carboxylase) ligase n=1 Tax=Puniceibacterium sediminis TaxID=1608407 RepID=A0A238XTI6_9RHOB|nr:biotin/lipoate--protein ligase family protein [Puniceibacterium sediminis]SNR62022.1 Biotin-(acetyl-CoA carboxylase) ligase [Puniceibacterium sediminis]
MSMAPQFPPLLSGLNAAGHDPFAAACQAAQQGCDAGLILYDLSGDLRAALICAPEVPLAQAMAMLPLCGVGLQNALGALAPPEVPVHLDWDGVIRVNGGRCGAFRAAASTADPAAIPDWLVIGFTLRFLITTDDQGATPDETALHGEGCGDLSPQDLLESWARHTLTWIHRWEEEGMSPLHREWSGLVHGLGQPVSQSGMDGTFLGVDEQLGMLLKSDGTTHLIPLTALLETQT